VDTFAVAGSGTFRPYLNHQRIWQSKLDWFAPTTTNPSLIFSGPINTRFEF